MQKEKSTFPFNLLGENMLGADNQQGSPLNLQTAFNDPSTTTRRTTILTFEWLMI